MLRFIGHKQSDMVRLLCRSDELLAEAATDTTHDKYKRRTYMPSAGYETATPVTKKLKAVAVMNCKRDEYSSLSIHVLLHLVTIKSS